MPSCSASSGKPDSNSLDCIVSSCFWCFTKFVGFSPNIEDYTEGCCFDLRSGTFCMSNPFHPDVLLPNDASKMLTLLRMNYENMHLFKMSRQERNQLLDVLLKYYGIHVPSFPEMHTLDVLRELF